VLRRSSVLALYELTDVDAHQGDLEFGIEARAGICRPREASRKAARVESMDKSIGVSGLAAATGTRWGRRHRKADSCVFSVLRTYVLIIEE
jgi:hypothetical protein